MASFPKMYNDPESFDVYEYSSPNGTCILKPDSYSHLRLFTPNWKEDFNQSGFIVVIFAIST